MSSQTPQYLIGQRVVVNDKEIGTVVVPENNNGKSDWNQTYVWVLTPSRGYPCCFAYTSIKPLPGGQL